LVKEGKGTVKHKEVILPDDLQKLYGHVNFSRETPEALQNRVFFEYLYYLFDCCINNFCVLFYKIQENFSTFCT
jgi:hypothetical protein